MIKFFLKYWLEKSYRNVGKINNVMIRLFVDLFFGRKILFIYV